jgi:hypothetical protein
MRVKQTVLVSEAKDTSNFESSLLKLGDALEEFRYLTQISYSCFNWELRQHNTEHLINCMNNCRHIAQNIVDFIREFVIKNRQLKIR